MRRIALVGLALAAVMAAGVAGYRAGDRGIAMPDVLGLFGGRSMAAERAEPRSGPVIYYRDPADRPVYSAVPRHADDGREFVPVQASEDVSFERPSPASAADDAAPAGSEAAATRRILYYRNPMGLADTSPVPKKDSMGMDYIAVYEGEDTGGSIVRVSAGRLQQTGVRTEIAVRQPVKRPMLVPGTVQLDERRIAVVATRSDAFVEQVANVTTGDRVTAGQALVRLYSPEIAAAAAQHLTELKIDTGSARLGGARQRLENLGVPAKMILEIERTRRIPLTVTWTAPRDGIVLERNVVEGMKAATGDVLFRLADIGTVWVLADVPEYELGSIRIGARATIRVRSQAGTSFEGRVSLIYPEVGTETRTTRVRIEIPNPDGVLLPNMYADVEIASGSEEPVVTVSDSAVIDTGTRQVVILDRGEGRFEPREVAIGRRGRGVVEIRDGVSEGDRVVVSANFLIYYYPTDHGWKFEGPLEKLMHAIGMFDRAGPLTLAGFDGSGADFMPEYRDAILDGKTIIASPHKVYGPETNDLDLQLRKRGIGKVILAGMSANLCVQAHLYNLLERGYEVAVVRDATAAAKLPEGDGYHAALTNFRYVANALWTTDEAVRRIASAA